MGGLMELDDACFGGVSHGPGKRGRGTDQDPTLVGVSLNEQGHPQYGFLEKVPDLTQDTVTQRLQEQVEPQSTWRTDGAEVYAQAAKALKATLEVTRSTDPQAAEVFHWVNVFISNAKAFLDGTYHGRGRTRRPLYFAEFVYRFNRRHFGSRLPERLLLACGSAHPHPYGT
ncbi:MAG TPA: IS1595 family transposase [Sulfobacillus sp.]|nr:IS1595 family transposase [Sulfobacillus sp.]